MHMFETEQITSKIDQGGHLILVSTSAKSTIESCPMTGRVTYRRRIAWPEK